MHDDALQERLADLETRLTFMDDTILTLADADALQSRRLLELEQAMHDLRAELASMRAALSDDPRNEPPPPHY
ncbi:MAG TPA: SlyX family protein [Rhodanobacteraceae bacterium]|nr:SlyX family protein [Rhodanobacteraceae bacterium]